MKKQQTIIKKKSLFDHINQITSVQHKTYWSKLSEAAKKELNEVGIGNLDFNDAEEDLFLETDETPLTLDIEV